MQDYSEKRDYPRMYINSVARYRVQGGDQVGSAVAKDLSGGGLLLQVESTFAIGTRLNVEIRPQRDITPPLYAEVEVVRCQADGATCNVACSMVRMLQADEVPAVFP